MKKKKLAFLLLLVAAASVLVLCLVLFSNKNKKQEKLVCVTSFYPIYLLAESVSEGVPGVTVTNLTANHTGCIHDYSLTTGDMKLLSTAKLFLVNGGGMELFLTKVAEDYSNLNIVDTSEGFAFLSGADHHHEGEEVTDSTEEAGDEHEHEEGALNSHIWLSIDGYLLQLSRVESAFVKSDPENAEKYKKNADRCRANLEELRQTYEEAAKTLSGKQTVVFHEGFVYLMKMLGVEVLHCMPMDSDTQILAGEAAEVVEESKLHEVKVFFSEVDYRKSVSDTFSKETGAIVVPLDALTGAYHDGQNPKDALSLYCNAMRENLTLVKKAFEGK